MKKLLSLILIVLLTQINVFAVTLDELQEAKPIMYRLGTTDTPEIKSDFNIEPVVRPTVKKTPTVKDKQNITYADLSIKNMSLEISKSIDVDYNEMQSDLSLLWQGAATGSDTIKFAIYKLSNPDKDKPDALPLSSECAQEWLIPSLLLSFLTGRSTPSRIMLNVLRNML